MLVLSLIMFGAVPNNSAKTCVGIVIGTGRYAEFSDALPQVNYIDGGMYADYKLSPLICTRNKEQYCK